MAKKDYRGDISNSADEFIDAAKRQDESLYESEAYGNPQPDEGMNVTVTKSVGLGGPVPIVAPKHNTVQLQPIIVPLAVVPYMTTDTNSLRTDTRQQPVSYRNDEYAEAVDFIKAENMPVKKKSRGKNRIFSLIIFLLSALTVVPFVLSYFKPIIGDVSLLDMNIIQTIINWITSGAPANTVTWILSMIGFCFLGLTVIISLISIVVGKLPKIALCITTFFGAAALLSELVYEIASDKLMVDLQQIFIATVAVSLAVFLFTVIFSLISGRRDDKTEAVQNNVI